MAAIELPTSLMRERSASWRIRASTFSPGQSGSGAFPIGRLDGGGLWEAQWNTVSLRTPDQVRAWRAFAALAENGVVPLVVPCCDKQFFPAPVFNGKTVRSYGAIPHAGGVLLNDGTGYYQPVVDCVTVGGAVSLRATQFTLRINVGSNLRGGEIFSINHPTQGWRRYEIKAIIETAGDSIVAFRPPLREAVPNGTRIEFDLPRCVMRLAQPDAMDIELDLRKFAAPSVAFVEYFYP